jgi:hypothetical protein
MIPRPASRPARRVGPEIPARRRWPNASFLAGKSCANFPTLALAEQPEG